ncbi:MAG: hypothetical protein BIFFINMI_02208 [Phycisphaerae bacterium]|nr:hypothetical protein [Phycisphaerae bacterium]
MLIALAAAASTARAADDDYDKLFDPAEAQKYQHKPKDLTETIAEHATTQPAAASQPDDEATTQPESPFADPGVGRRDLLPGYIELSDSRVLAGRIYTTRDKPWSVYDAASKSFRRIPPVVVARIDVELIWERDQPEWRWKEGGSDEKVYTGRTYPARLLEFTYTLVNGMKIAGTVQQPIYVLPPGSDDPVRFILHERQKGELGQPLADLPYVEHVVLGQAAQAEGLARMKQQADAASKAPPTTQAAAELPPGFTRVLAENPKVLDDLITKYENVRGLRVHHLGKLRFELLIPPKPSPPAKP